MKKRDLLFVIYSFVSWRILLFVFLFLAVRFLPLQQHFLGGGMGNYLRDTWFWAWANFDGENYITIAQYGHLLEKKAFFPLYPLLIKYIGNLFGGGMVVYTTVGVFISNFSFLAALVGLYKLLRLDYSRKVTRAVVLLILVFPTSFYFGSVYSESMFLALVVWCFYAFRRNSFPVAGILGALASATRMIGVFILPALLVEYFLKSNQLKFKNLKKWGKAVFLLLIPSGLIFYMYYLSKHTGDSLAFIKAQSIVGEHRSLVPVVLPQVFYRYAVKVLPNLNYHYFPSVFSAWLEFAVGVVFFLISVASFWKTRWSYAIFLSLSFLLPSLSGSFSSLPRYVLVLFPAFIVMAVWVGKLSRPLRIALYGTLFVGLVLASGMFLRGYWIS